MLPQFLNLNMNHLAQAAAGSMYKGAEHQAKSEKERDKAREMRFVVRKQEQEERLQKPEEGHGHLA